MKLTHGLVSPHWPMSALTAHLLALAALAQSPLPDSFNPGADGQVSCLAVQTDGKVLVGGEFGPLSGQAGFSIGRVNADGTLDADFNSNLSLPPLSHYGFYFANSLVVLADGKIVVGGDWGFKGDGGGYIFRFDTDGVVEPSFSPWAGGSVFSSALGADGKIFVGGVGVLERLNADGTLDSSFNPSADIGGWIYCLALQADGKILVGGSFITLDGQSCTNIGRLNADGTLDASFNPGSDGEVHSLAQQADEKILVGGIFGTLGGQSRTNIGRLNVDGTLDTNFNTGADGEVNSLALQTDGKILIGGSFGTLSGGDRFGIGRLNSDGTLDTSFDPGTDGSASALALEADGKILVGGGFGTLGGQSRTNIGRLNNTGPATQSLAFDGSTLTWLRGGTSPEVWRTTFESAPDAASWTNLGAGVRIPGGWQLTGLALPTNTNFRARGYTVGGSGNGSGWYVETVLPPTLSISRPLYSANGQFGFILTGPAGQLVVVEASADLVTWLPIWTNTLTGPLHFSDPQSGSHAKRFYRAHAP